MGINCNGLVWVQTQAAEIHDGGPHVAPLAVRFLWLSCIADILEPERADVGAFEPKLALRDALHAFQGFLLIPFEILLPLLCLFLFSPALFFKFLLSLTFRFQLP